MTHQQRIRKKCRDFTSSCMKTQVYFFRIGLFDRYFKIWTKNVCRTESLIYTQLSKKKHFSKEKSHRLDFFRFIYYVLLKVRT